jgi:type IV pilus assembly protein PilM
MMESEFMLVAAKIITMEKLLAHFNNYPNLKVTQIVLEPLAILTALEYQDLDLNRQLDDEDEVMGVISLGAESTTLMFVRKNDEGILRSVWNSEIPVGGVHWTKQLAKELKLTWAKAEHLKRNIVEAEDAKAVIQAMRPVFNDLLSETQHRIGFFKNINRKTVISKFLLIGDGFLLPGLVQYLQKNLDVECEFWKGEPNRLIAFGLALQGLNFGDNVINLMPTKKLVNLDLGWIKRMIPRWRNPLVFDRR